MNTVLVTMAEFLSWATSRMDDDLFYAHQYHEFLHNGQRVLFIPLDLSVVVNFLNRSFWKVYGGWNLEISACENSNVFGGQYKLIPADCNVSNG